VTNSGIGPSGYHRKYYSDRDWRSYSHILGRIVTYSSPGPILDLGAGCGHLIEASSLWGIESTGLEGSLEAVEIAKSRVPTLDMRHQLLSDPLPFPANSYQTIVLNQVIEHLEHSVARAILIESMRVLRPKGLIIITSPSSANKAELIADPTHINLMSPSELKHMLISIGFERVTPFNSPLPIFGRSRLARGLLYVLFRLLPFDSLSASSNAMAFKG
jgi:SAM-dependent methyltransferase